MEAIKSLDLNDFKKLVNQTNTIVLDVRNQVDFVKGHIPNSVFIGLDGLFGPWVKLFIDQDKYSVLLIIPEGRENETFEKLKAINYTTNLSYLKGGFNSWATAQLKTETIKSITALELENILKKEEISIFDIRKINEYEAGHIKDVLFSPLADLNQTINSFNLGNETSYIHCGGGYRSVIAASILKRNSIHNVVDIAGGMGAIRKTGIDITTD